MIIDNDVNSALLEPEPGWIDSLSSLTAILGATGKGILRVDYGRNKYINIIPVDVCVNGMLAAAYYRDATIRGDCSGANIIFNATDMDIDLEDVREYGYSLEFQFPLSGQLWRGHYIRTSNYILFHILTLLLHIVPGVLGDLVLRLRGKKPILQRLYRKIYNATLSLQHFTQNSWVVDRNNFFGLKEKIHPDDKDILYLKTLDKATRKEYYFATYMGMRKMFGDTPLPTKKDITLAHRLYWVDLVFRISAVGFVVWMLLLSVGLY